MVSSVLHTSNGQTTMKGLFCTHCWILTQSCRVGNKNYCMWISHPDTFGLILPQTLLREMLGSSAWQGLPSSCLAGKGKESPSAVTPQNDNADSLCCFGNISYSWLRPGWVVWKCSVSGVAQAVVSLLPVQATQEELLALEWFGLNTTHAGRKGDSQGGGDLCIHEKEPAHIHASSHIQTPSWATAHGRRDGMEPTPVGFAAMAQRSRDEMELTPAAQGETAAIPLWLTPLPFWVHTLNIKWLQS